jgi:LPXTG-motif cell wall-anchored protein
MTVWPGQISSFEGLIYEVSGDNLYFSILVDGTTRVIQMASTLLNPSSLRPTNTAAQTGSTSTAAQTIIETSSVSVDPSATNTKLPKNTNLQGKTGVSTEAMVGIVLGVIVFLAVILGVVLFLLRRKKKHRAAKGIVPGEREGGESDKIVVESEETKDNPHDYRPQYTELSGNSQVQELDSASGEVATLRANEMLGGNGQIDKLHNGQHTLPSHFSESSFPPADMPASASAPAPSPYVDAQKKVEISWLESEEAKLRQRREQLMMQSAERESDTSNI